MSLEQPTTNSLARRAQHSRRSWSVALCLGLALVSVGVATTSGCAMWPPENEKPQTVTDWMKLDRVKP